MNKHPVEKFDEAVSAKKSVLCLGLDPDPLLHRNTFEKHRFCMNIVDAVAEFVSAVKVNENFVRDFSAEDHRKLTDKIHEEGCVAIYDCKMCDIENTVRAGIILVAEMGYDFITFNPVMGTLPTAVKYGREHSVGTLVLLHPSNKESEKFFRQQLADGRKLYEKILAETHDYGAEGVVVGLHPQLTTEEVLAIRSFLGDEKIILFPGVGAQGGDIDTALKAGGRLIVNIGRSIVYSSDPRETAAKFHQKIMETMMRR
ncbi:MAG: orotidine-5'-phosphate decarboxylase [Candidatus Caldarchaeum sp.]|uniref:Orotidine-5'-phosphate decarboxylase n=1 Tax=Caldiarchaeum subterraneum TaxID=311458 RepID=A0A7C5U7X3_CALS0